MEISFTLCKDLVTCKQNQIFKFIPPPLVRNCTLYYKLVCWFGEGVDRHVIPHRLPNNKSCQFTGTAQSDVSLLQIKPSSFVPFPSIRPITEHFLDSFTIKQIIS